MRLIQFIFKFKFKLEKYGFREQKEGNVNIWKRNRLNRKTSTAREEQNEESDGRKGMRIKRRLVSFCTLINCMIMMIMGLFSFNYEYLHCAWGQISLHCSSSTMDRKIKIFIYGGRRGQHWRAVCTIDSFPRLRHVIQGTDRKRNISSSLCARCSPTCVDHRRRWAMKATDGRPSPLQRRVAEVSL